MIKSKLHRIKQRVAKKGVYWALFSTYRYLANNKKKLLNDFVRSKLLVGGHTLSHAMYTKVYQMFLNKKLGRGVEVMQEDWDNLILLDAYRYDYFQKYSTLDGALHSKISKGNWSLEFICKNFSGNQYHDTILVTANPNYQNYSKLDEGTFFTIINVVDDKPDAVTEEALAAVDQYQNKRIILHYMLPHAPFRGQVANQVKYGLDGEISNNMFSLYRRGLISKQTLERAYIESIEQIENEVKNLLQNLDGKTVVSSDHGENLGEIQHGMMQLGHGNPTTECRIVPWLEMDYDERRNVIEDDPIGINPVDNDIIGERLAALGYK